MPAGMGKEIGDTKGTPSTSSRQSMGLGSCSKICHHLAPSAAWDKALGASLPQQPWFWMPDLRHPTLSLRRSWGPAAPIVFMLLHDRTGLFVAASQSQRRKAHCSALVPCARGTRLRGLCLSLL